MTTLYNHKHVLIVIKRVALAVCRQGVCLKLCAVAEGRTSVSCWPGLNTELLTPKTVGEVTPQRVFDASFLIWALQTLRVQAGTHTCAHKQTQMVLSLGNHMDFFQVLEINWLIPHISCPSDLTLEVPDPQRKTLKAQRDRPLDCGNCTVHSCPIKTACNYREKDNQM